MLVEECLRGEEGLAIRRAAGADDESAKRDAEPVADILLELPGPVLPAAAQVDDGADPSRLQARDLVRGRLGRAPQPVGDPVLVQVEEPEDAVIGQQHMRPRRAHVRTAPRTGLSQRAIRAMRRA